MMKKSGRRGRQFPPQISKEELLNRTRNELTKKGVDNVSEAKYIIEISTEVVGYDDPIFYSLQPEIKFRDSQAWQISYAIVLDFLKDMKMTNTLESIEIELENQELARSNLDCTAVEYLTKLIQVSRRLARKTFAARVAEFTGKYRNKRAAAKANKANTRGKVSDPNQMTSVTETTKNVPGSSPKATSSKLNSPKTDVSPSAKKLTPKTNTTSFKMLSPRGNASQKSDKSKASPNKNNTSFQEKLLSEEYSDAQSESKKVPPTKVIPQRKRTTTKINDPPSNKSSTKSGQNSTASHSETVDDESAGTHTFDDEQQSNIISDEVALSLDEAPKKSSKSSHELEFNSSEEVQEGSNINDDDILIDVDFED